MRNISLLVYGSFDVSGTQWRAHIADWPRQPLLLFGDVKSQRVGATPTADGPSEWVEQI